MKAWKVNPKGEFGTAVVFAETVGKAKSVALLTEACLYCELTDIEVRRCPEADTYYTKGKIELDWLDPQDRIILVRDCGFSCEKMEMQLCDGCFGKDYCDATGTRWK